MQKTVRWLLAFLILLKIAVPAACALDAQSGQTSPGEQQAQELIDQAPLTLEQFVSDPFGSLQAVLGDAVFAALREEAGEYARLFTFLLLGGVLMLCIPAARDMPLLELICTAGAFLLAASPVLGLITEFCGRVTGWKNYLASFVPVFAAVMVSGGQSASAAVYSGFFLSIITLLAQGIEQLALPLMQCFLALSAAGVLSGSEEAGTVCEFVGQAMQKTVKLAAGAFTAIMSLQRLFSASVDNAALRVGKTLGSTVPVIGQTLTAASEAILSAVAVLKVGLGFAAIAVIGAEFVPLYLRILLHLLFLHLCVLLSALFGLAGCARLFRCMAAALEAVSALAVLFFSMVIVATALMLSFGNGG